MMECRAAARTSKADLPRVPDSFLARERWGKMEDLEGKELRDGVTPRRDGRLPLGGSCRLTREKAAGGGPCEPPPQKRSPNISCRVIRVKRGSAHAAIGLTDVRTKPLRAKLTAASSSAPWPAARSARRCTPSWRYCAAGRSGRGRLPVRPCWWRRWPR